MADVDETAEAELGDEFTLAIDGVTFVTIKGFVYPPGSEPQIGFGAIDPMQGKPRVKIAKAVLAQPSKANRLKIPQLADPLTTSFRPENWDLIDAGRQWIIDVQEALAL